MMKKASLILSLLMFGSISAYAVTPQEVQTQQYIEGHGHSTEMARLIDLQKHQINETPCAYVGNDKKYYSNKGVKVIRNFFMYLDGALDDGKFMQNQTEYTTNWKEF